MATELEALKADSELEQDAESIRQKSVELSTYRETRLFNLRQALVHSPMIRLNNGREGHSLRSGWTIDNKGNVLSLRMG